MSNKDLEVSNNRSKELTLSVLKALLAGIPTVGGALSSLVGDHMQNIKSKRIQTFIGEIENSIADLQNKQLNVEKIHSPEYAYIFEKCFRGVAENYQTERLEAYKAILINSLLESAPSEDETDLFISFINNLSVIHIRVLGVFNDFLGYCEKNKLENNQIIQKEFRVAYPDLKLDVEFSTFLSACEQLFLLGLSKFESTAIRNLKVTAILNKREKILTDLGIRFINFVTLDAVRS